MFYSSCSSGGDHRLHKTDLRRSESARQGEFRPRGQSSYHAGFSGRNLSDKDKVGDVVFDAVKRSRPCDVSLQKFILLNKGTVAALEIKKNDALSELRENVSGALSEAGFTIDLKPFRPHVTVARKISYELPYRDICKTLTIYNRPQIAKEVVFYCSTLRREGALYEPLSCFRLE